MANDKTYCVIMAGGIGSRFWPMSRTTKPKQFLDILGVGRSLLQMTHDRFSSFIPHENIFVVTNEHYEELVREQLPGLREDRIITEPERKNTAPCVAYAAFRIGEEDPGATIVIAPSDHLILKEEAFHETIEVATSRANAKDSLVTLGIKPTRADTGYGYIQFTDANDTSNKAIKKVQSFTEKPDEKTAEKFLKAGNYYWNSGIFIWTVKAIKQALKSHLPQLYELFEGRRDKYNTQEEPVIIRDIYQKAENISIDHGVMEKAQNVDVVLGDLGWSDLGTWGALYEHLKKDEAMNAFIGDQTMARDATGNIVSTSEDKLVVLQGIENTVVVESGDVLLICDRNHEQKIKKLVEEVRNSKGEDLI